MQRRMTISGLARAEGVDKALMSRRVKQLKLETFPGPRRAKLITIASYLKALGRPATEELRPPIDELDRMARKGSFGAGVQAAARLETARRYKKLSERFANGDMKAAALMAAINKALGEDAAARCHALLVEDRPIRYFFEADRRYVLRSFREHLDCIATQFSHYDSACAAASAARPLTAAE